jgi:hypothetical protein
MALRISRLNISITGTSRSAIRAFKSLQDASTPLVRNLGRVVRAAKLVSGAFAGIAAIGAGFSIGKAFGDIDDLAKFSTRLGIGIEQLQALELAGARAGISQRNLRLSLQRSTRRIAEAAEGTGEAVSALNELQLDPEFLKSQSAFNQLQILTKAFAGIESQADKVRLAFKLFDSEGVAILQLMAGGAEGLRQAARDMERFGGAISRIDASKIEAANDAFTNLRFALELTAKRLAVDVAPLVQKVAESLTEVVPTFSRVFSAVRAALADTEGPLRIFGDTVEKLLSLGSGQTSLESFLLRAVGSIGDAIENILAGIKQLILSIRSAIGETAATIGELLTSLGATDNFFSRKLFGEDGLAALTKAGDSLTAFGQKAVDSVRTAQEALNEQLVARPFSETFKAQFDEIAASAEAARKRVDDALSEQISGRATPVVNAIVSLKDDVGALGVAFGRAIGDTAIIASELLKGTVAQANKLFVSGPTTAGVGAFEKGSVEAARAISEARNATAQREQLAIDRRVEKTLEQSKTIASQTLKFLKAQTKPLAQSITNAATEIFNFGSTS